jgi:hypothetical protein
VPGYTGWGWQAGIWLKIGSALRDYNTARNSPKVATMSVNPLTLECRGGNVM